MPLIQCWLLAAFTAVVVPRKKLGQSTSAAWYNLGPGPEELVLTGNARHDRPNHTNYECFSTGCHYSTYVSIILAIPLPSFRVISRATQTLLCFSIIGNATIYKVGRYTK
ncbi:hypothetical protein F5B21DRAFT_433924 [Xylaria acuta]|nr:hypothetical protein F5B21DRAFT_433924 [Xylaria acuta]